MNQPATAGPKRASKLSSLEQALQVIKPGMLVALGGLWFQNNPSAAVRAIARAELSNLKIVAAPPSSYAVDLLLGAGCVSEATVGHVSFEHMGLAPNFRRVAQDGSATIIDADEATILGGLMATLEHLPEHPVSSVRATDLIHSPVAPMGAWNMVAPKPLRPDVCLLHAQEADVYGNIRCFGTPFCDPLFAKASAHVIVTVDRIIANDIIRAEPNRTTIPGYLIDAVIEAPGGAHPCSSQGLYPHDETAIRSYIAAGADAAQWRQDYLTPFVLNPENLAAYIAALGGAAHLAALQETVK